MIETKVPHIQLQDPTKNVLSSTSSTTNTNTPRMGFDVNKLLPAIHKLTPLINKLSKIRRHIIPDSLLPTKLLGMAKYRHSEMLRLSDARQLLKQPYLPTEAGYGLTSDNMLHVAAVTYMPNCTAAMIDWWFGFIHTTEHYKWWHPRDHVFSDWDGLRENKSEYIGGTHLVHEYIGGELEKLAITFKDPSIYFGRDWKQSFRESGYGTAICGRVGAWSPEQNTRIYTGHLIHLVKDEPTNPDGSVACRMRSRFWLGDIEGLDVKQGDKIPKHLGVGLLKHATEEMSILASKLPGLYEKYRRRDLPDGDITEEQKARI